MPIPPRPVGALDILVLMLDPVKMFFVVLSWFFVGRMRYQGASDSHYLCW